MWESRKDLVWIIRITLIIALGLIAYFMTLTVIIPVSRYKIEVPEKKPGLDKVFLPDQNWLLSLDDSVKNKAFNLLSSESFLISRLAMTSSDSISMAISLKDSSIALVVQGVAIYKAKIQFYQTSRALTEADPVTLAQWLSSPFIVSSHLSSIPKVPVLYKKAPKDTIEAMSQLELDPLKDDLDPVSFSLILDRKLTLSFEQAETPEKGYLRKLKAYKRHLKAISRKEIFSHLFRCEPIDFIPEINIVLDRKAARVIYRALPVDALVAIQLSVYQ
jgi:hypothetical protein